MAMPPGINLTEDQAIKHLRTYLGDNPTDNKLISGEELVSIVLNMPTTGPLLLKALMAQDMYLAGSFLMLTSVLTVIGTLISDILLAALDPRIRFGALQEEG